MGLVEGTDVLGVGKKLYRVVLLNGQDTWDEGKQLWGNSCRRAIVLEYCC